MCGDGGVDYVLQEDEFVKDLIVFLSRVNHGHFIGGNAVVLFPVA